MPGKKQPRKNIRREKPIVHDARKKPKKNVRAAVRKKK